MLIEVVCLGVEQKQWRNILSKHEITVVPITLEPHSNADALSIVRVWGYTVCCRTSDWIGKTKAIYVPPDYIVPLSRSEFKFLDDGKGKTDYRVKVKRLRGVLSQGLLIPAPEDAEIGEDFMERLEIKRYEPPEPNLSTGGEAEKPPDKLLGPKYDIENLERYVSQFQELVGNNLLVVTEKVDGCNASFTWWNDRLYCKSRSEWKRESEGSLWWRVAKQYPQIEEFCKANPEATLYGEIYGYVQSLRYGLPKGQVAFAVFDVWKDGWVPYCEAKKMTLDLLWVPELGTITFDLEMLRALAEGQSTLANHVKEGIVIKPYKKELWSPEFGRAQLKLIGEGYYKNELS